MVATASEAWAIAQRMRRAVLKVIDQIEKSGADGSGLDRLKDVDNLMASYRLACIETLWFDIQYAADEKVEVALWQTHIFLNSTYRKLLNKFTPQQVVLKRKVEKLYLGYLKVSQFFYKGYMQRLCARYIMPELQRIVQGAELDRMSIPEEDRIDPVAAGIRHPVISSCHLTLTYMGDLSRYRSLVRPHGRNFESSLTYYSLANDLMPDSGYGYHQMGLIFLEQKKHVEIVYHFYRALAAAKPHPNAKSNLDVEFRDLLRPATPRAHSPFDAFTAWFVRLHAYFHRGEDFTQRAELEEEVLHRFRMALKADDFGPTLLKMVLINICAYQVAEEKIKAEWTATGSRSCQFVLGFNVRTIHVIARVIRAELVDLINRQPEVANDEDGTRVADGSRDKFSTALGAGLPLLRVYMTWLCAYSADIVQFQAHLEPHVGDMYKTLSQALSGLFELLDDSTNVGTTAPYLLPEDIQTLGLKCLDDPGLPAACRLCIDPFKRTQKPRAEELGRLNIKPDDVSFTRALDIVACAMALAEDAVFPFAMSQVNKGSRELTQVIFLEEGKTGTIGGGHMGVSDPGDPEPAIGDLATMLSKLQASPITAGMESVPRGTSIDAGEERAVSGTRSKTAAAVHTAQHLPGSAQDAASSLPQMATDTEYAMDSQLYGIVNDFLAPPESHSQEGSRGKDETSYGMHSETAKEVFGSMAAAVSPGPGSGTKKSFPSLPWGYFYTPTPQKSGPPEGASQHAWDDAPPLRRGKSTAHGVTIQGFEGLEDPFTLAKERYTSMASASGEQRAAPEQAAHHGLGTQGLIFKDGSRQSLAGAGSSSAWNSGAGWNYQGTHMPGQFSLAGQPRPASVQALRHMHDAMAPVGAPFSSLTFSATTSSLPPVNSPWGLPQNPHGNANQSNGFAASDMPQYGPHAGLYSQSSNATQSSGYPNGHGYNAPAPYGHGQFPGQNDPDCLKHFAKGAALGDSVAESEARDWRTLYSALEEDYNKLKR